MPPGVVIVTLTVLDPAGAVAVISVADTTIGDNAAVEPKSTAVAPVKPVPVIVMCVPPPSGPASGLIPLIAGTGS